MSKYRRGQSGNPTGRPKGIADKRVTLRALLEPHAPMLVATVVKKALKGDMAAMRICIDRLIPSLKARDAAVNIGSLEGTLSEQGKAVLGAVTGGRVTPDEASSLMQAIAAQARIVEVDDFERRIEALEDARHSAGKRRGRHAQT
jgi:hypothetical protein